MRDTRTTSGKKRWKERHEKSHWLQQREEWGEKRKNWIRMTETERVEHKEPFSLFSSISINRNRTIISDAHSLTGLFSQTTEWRKSNWETTRGTLTLRKTRNREKSKVCFLTSRSESGVFFRRFDTRLSLLFNDILPSLSSLLVNRFLESKEVTPNIKSWGPWFGFLRRKDKGWEKRASDSGAE